MKEFKLRSTSVLVAMSIFLMFPLFCYSGFLLIFQLQIQYSLFALFVGGISFFLICIEISDNRMRVSNVALKMVGLFTIVAISFIFVTPYLYGNAVKTSLYRGEQLVVLGQSFPTMIVATILGRRDYLQQKLKLISFYVGIAFSVIALICEMSRTTLSAEVYGLNYQTISYMAAYGMTFAIYVLLNIRQLYKKKIKRNIAAIICLIMILTDWYTIMFSGGRGGFLVGIVICPYAFWLFIHQGAGKPNYNRLQKSVPFLFLVLISLILVIVYVQNSNGAISGLFRIVNFLKHMNDSARSELFNLAWKSFRTSPIVGHGIGSVFYEVGFYSHNLIMDLLVETGIVGLLVVFSFMWKAYRYSLKRVYNDKSEMIWNLLLISSLLRYCVSGYYLDAFELIWIVFMIVIKYYSNIDTTSKCRIVPKLGV